MLLLQTFFFFLFLLFTLLISFSTSHVIHLNSDLRSLVFGRLTPSTLFHFPEEYILKEAFHMHLENWLGGLKKWNDDELANVKSANKMADKLKLAGKTKDTSLELSDPDNTQPAPWVLGLAIILNGYSHRQLIQDLVKLMPWLLIPDGQIFHFIMVYQKVTEAKTGEFNFRLYRQDRKDLEFYCAKNPKKSKVDDFNMYNFHASVKPWIRLWEYPWLMKHAELGEIALKQLLSTYQECYNSLSDFASEKQYEELASVKVELEKELNEKRQ